MAAKKETPKTEEVKETTNVFSEEKIDEALNQNQYISASKAEKKEIYTRPQIFSEFDDDTELETDDILTKKDFLELVASAKSNRILSGTITGTRWAGEPYKSTLLAKIGFGNGTYAVIIPSYVLFDYDVPKYKDSSNAQQLENAVIKRLGSEVKFLVKTVDEANQVAYADRLAALSIQGYEYYMRPMKDGKPQIVDGMIVKSKIVSVSNNGVVVNAAGCEISIGLNELSYYHVGNAKNEYKIGQALPVKVTNIESVTVEKNGTPYRLIKAEGSVKATEPVDPRIKAFEKYHVGEICMGVVTGIADDGVYMRINNTEGRKTMMDIKVDSPRFGEWPSIGDKRLVLITHMYEDNHMLRGVFKNH